MKMQHDYLQAAQAHEREFRAILRDLKQNRASRPAGAYVPDDLDAESPLVEIFERYSSGTKSGVFTITDFIVTAEGAEIHFQDIAPLSGGGAGLKYSISQNGEVTYAGHSSIFMC